MGEFIIIISARMYNGNLVLNTFCDFEEMVSHSDLKNNYENFYCYNSHRVYPAGFYRKVLEPIACLM